MGGRSRPTDRADRPIPHLFISFIFLGKLIFYPSWEALEILENPSCEAFGMLEDPSWEALEILEDTGRTEALDVTATRFLFLGTQPI